MKEVYGEGIPELDDIFVSNWTTNENFKGAWLALPKGTSWCETELQTPFSSTFYIAGEAISDCSGTTHGAYDSGINRAQLILSHYHHK